MFTLGRNPNPWAEAGKSVLQTMGADIDRASEERRFNKALESIDDSALDDPIPFLKNLQKTNPENQKVLLAGYEAKKTSRDKQRDIAAAQQMATQLGIKIPEWWGTKELTDWRKNEAEIAKKNRPTGKTTEPIAPETMDIISQIDKEFPNASGPEKFRKYVAAGVPSAQAEKFAKLDTEAAKSSLSETAKLRESYAAKGSAAKQTINQKKNLKDLISRGNINDPTIAVVLENLPFKLGKRFLSDDTIAYKAGLVDEFKDLRNIFQGQTRVKEIEILEEKVADTYLTDAQKLAVLNARIDALEPDIIRADIAADLERENPYLGVAQFERELERRYDKRMEENADKVIDQLKQVQREADAIKRRPLSASDPEGAQVIKQIFIEIGAPEVANKQRAPTPEEIKKAEKLAKDKGYNF